MSEKPPLLPSVSIVMPIYNRAAFLDLCLPPLLAQTYPRDRYEIILVDDGSTDHTAERAQAIAQGWAGSFRAISQPNGGPASARNAGIHASQADVIAFIDSDCVATTDWLRCLVDGLLGLNVSGVGAPFVGVETGNWVARYLEAMNFYRHRVRRGRVDYLLTGNVAFRRQALLEVGGFLDRPGVWGEDADLSFKLIAAGHRLGVIDCGAVRHFGTPTSVRSLARNLFRYGQSNALLSSRWNNGRTPLVEITRHMGAAVLSPLIALARTPRVGLWQALSFIPLIVVEHSAFSWGVISGVLHLPKHSPQAQ